MTEKNLASKPNGEIEHDHSVEVDGCCVNEPGPSASACHDSCCSGGHSHGMPPGDSAALYAQLANLLKVNESQQNMKTKKDDYKFWKTQPVPDFDENTDENKAIDDTKTKADIRTEPYPLPDQFYWDDLDLNNDEQLNELYELLYHNYVEDDDHMFRFDYSREFLKWALMPPDWIKHWHCGIRTTSGMKPLVGFIGATPTHISIHGTEKKVVEINFLCVHKKLRSKRMAPVLIKEITRRANRKDIFQAVYTSGTQLPRPVTSSRYWHRPLNIAKLIECQFSSLRPNMTIPRMVKLYKLPTEYPALDGEFKPLTAPYAKRAHDKLCKYLERFKIHQKFTVGEFKHWFLPRDNIINTYIVVNNKDEVTDMCSFYTLPSTVFGCPKHNKMTAAYAFYNFTTVTPIDQLMQCALIAAKQLGYDVFNALDVMEHEQFLEKLKFGGGDGNLRYYIYNWICPVIKPNELALILQ